MILKGHNWTKGLTKETDERVAKRTETKRRNHPSGSDCYKRTVNLRKERYGKSQVKDQQARTKKILETSDVWIPKMVSTSIARYGPLRAKNPQQKLENMRKAWADPEKKITRLKSVINGWHKKPNKKEKILIDLFLELNLPYGYYGDKIKLNLEKMPDFIHATNPKIIELFGNYWHKKSEEEERINYFRKNGYDCLIIWESELKNMNDVIIKIKEYDVSFLW